MAVENDRPERAESSASDSVAPESSAEAFADLSAALRAELDGEVRFDEYAQVLYATDGSIYGARPAGVVAPTGVEDVQAAVRLAADHDVPVLPRGAGSSLAGQAVGPGCLVLDLSVHMDDIVSVDPDARRAVVQPGVVQDDLDAHLAQWGLKFAPDPASSNRATVGGGIGNNSTGAHSVRYGITDAYTEELDVVLADGSLVHTREVVLDGEEWDEIVGRDDLEARIYRTVRAVVEDNAEEIEARYPELKRSVSGYNLQKVIYENANGDRVINLSKLLSGAEGTLGIVVCATVSLVTRPEETALALYCFDDLVTAMAAVPEALEFDPGAVELMDAEVFRLARDSAEFAEYAGPIPKNTEAALMLEFDSELHADFEASIAETNDRLLDRGAAFDVLEAYSPEAQASLWKLRKAAIPLLMSLDGDPKPYPFVEDASVPPAELAEYVQEFEAILDAHGTRAAYFAHAGSGTLHVRPILNLKDGEEVETMRAIAEDVTSLVLDHEGSFSGEHGDGLARTQFNRKLYGDQLWEAFERVKTAFDPDWRMNPGKVVYRDETPTDMREHLRYGADYASVEPGTTLDFSEEGGFAHLVELCNGCGTCRQTGSDVMCPTYRASKDELLTTRGRANMLRAAISGDLPADELYSERFQREVLDLCIGCKGCKSDCPTGVDMAKLKAEAKHQYHRREGTTLRERLFADIDRVAALGSATAPVSNWLARLPGARTVAERTLDIAPERTLPTFRRETFADWMADREARRASENANSAEQRSADHSSGQYAERGSATSETAKPSPSPREDGKVVREARYASRDDETPSASRTTVSGSEAGVSEADAIDRVLLFPDTYTNYSYPEVGKAAVRVLEAADVHVRVPDGVGPSGRAAYSTGHLTTARERAERNVAALAPLVRDGWSVLSVEPSDAVMFQDEYRDLLSGEAVETVAANAYGVCEYLDTHRRDGAIEFRTPTESLTYHGHCNQKALGADHHAVAVLRRAGYAVDVLDSGCCGMAGSFGYEREHYDLSRAIGRILFDQVDESDGDTVVAPGASCRTQLGDRPGAAGEQPPHPVEKLAALL